MFYLVHSGGGVNVESNSESTVESNITTHTESNLESNSTNTVESNIDGTIAPGYIAFLHFRSLRGNLRFAGS